jgi:hypothetical protein
MNDNELMSFQFMQLQAEKGFEILPPPPSSLLTRYHEGFDRSISKVYVVGPEAVSIQHECPGLRNRDLLTLRLRAPVANSRPAAYCVNCGVLYIAPLEEGVLPIRKKV